MSLTKVLCVFASVALAGLCLVCAQEPPLPVKTGTPDASPGPAVTRPQLNIPEIPLSVEPPTLVLDAPNSTPGPKPRLPAAAKSALPLSQLDAAFQRSPLAQAAEEQRLHLEWRQLQNRTAQDPEVLAAREAAAKAKTDREKRALLRTYYQVYYGHMRALASSPAAKAYLDAKKAAALGGLEQPRVRPHPAPRPTPPH